MRFAAHLALLLLAALAAPSRADDAGLARCGVARLTMLAQACGDVLTAESRRVGSGDAAGFDRRIAQVRRRAAAAWAASAGDDPRCADVTALADAAVDRLLASVRAAGAVLGPECRRTLLRLWRPLCRMAAMTEVPFVEGRPDAAEVRGRTLARIRARLAARWPGSGCAAALDVGSATDALLGMAGGVAGDGTTRGLAALATAAGRAVGAAVEPGEVADDPVYAGLVPHELTSLTAENAMKWQPIHPAPDTWQFGPADAVVALADAHGLRLRGHTLVWGALQVPAWVTATTDPAALRALMAEHVATVAGRWAGRIAQWDVVNEPLSAVTDAPTADGLDDNVFRRLLGPGYVAEALHLARAADPAAKLFVNENGIELPGPRQDRFFALVQDLLAAGAPLDGVGFQAHVGLIPPAQYPDRATVEASLRRFAALGLDVELTELDVALVFRTGDLPSRFARQGGDYRALLEACLAVPRCTGVTTWGLGDRLTWLRSFFGIDDWPLPFDDAWGRKPAWFGMRAAFLAHALRRG